ncbi:MAG: efflux RND transporter permease subunit [Bacteroidales bacterium]|nr:efflux RND transporter permease subunit [Bacteroidales bacterium]
MNRNLLKRPIAVSMCLIAITVMGILALKYIPVSLMPDIDIPRITVHVNMPGYSAQEIEKNVVSPLRGRLMQVAGVTDVSSESRMDAGSVHMNFEPGSNIDILFIEVNEKVDRAMDQMPKGMDRPKVVKASVMDIPVFFLDIMPKDNTRFAQLSRFVKVIVAKRIEQLPQTAMVDISGTVGSEIECIPYYDKLNALGMSVNDLENAIKRNNITLEALSVVDGLYRYNIHFDSQLLTKQDIEDIYINHDGRILQMKDVCSINEKAAGRNGLVKHDGKEAVTLAIIKQNDARMEDLQKNMNSLLDDMRREYPDIRFELTRDQTKLLSYTISNLKGNLYIGAIMATLVLLIFMRRWRLSLLVIMCIPVSLIITLLCFYMLGISLNIISLSGLILGVGMMVDNAIIVIDNIDSEKMYDDLYKMVSSKVREVFAPMLSSVLTTCSVFVPLIFLSGTAGSLFYDLAMGITTALFASLLVATVAVPVYYAALHRKQKQAIRSSANKNSSKVHLNILNAIPLYEYCLRWTLRHIKTCILIFACTIIVGGVLIITIEKERMPNILQEDTLITLDWNSNISVDENDRRTNELMTQLDEFAKTSTNMVGAQEFMLSHTKDITSSESVVYFQATNAEELKKAKKKAFDYISKHYPQASIEFGESGNLYDLIFNTDEADLEIHLQTDEGRRPEVDQSRAFRDTLLVHFKNLEIAPVMTETDIRYVADAEQIAVYKVHYDALYRRLKELVSSSCIFNINDGAQSVPVIVSGDKKRTEHLLESTVTNNEGTEIPLSYLVRESKGEDYKRLQAGNGGEYYVFNLNAKDRDVEKVMNFVNEYVHRPNSKYSASFSGGYFSGRKLINELTLVLIVALALLFFILAAQFESLIQPFIILAEMVIDVFFVILGLQLMGESLNLMSMTGLVVMGGIVINDSILKIDTINRNIHLKSGTRIGLLRAIVEAGHKRLRPIIMTSLTTILALLPFLNKSSMGSAIQYPLSLALVIGMTVGTIVSLFFVPMLYYIIYRKK